MRYGTEGDDKESNKLLHGQFLPTLRRSEQAWEPYRDKGPLRGSVTEGEKCKLLEIGDALKLHVETCYVS